MVCSESGVGGQILYHRRDRLPLSGCKGRLDRPTWHLTAIWKDKQECPVVGADSILDTISRLRKLKPRALMA